MTDRFKQFPAALASQARAARLGPLRIPALLAHPDWARPAPVAIWLHGRTAYKEMDPGRYLRWIRAGVGVCAIDLPGHGERGQGVDQQHGPHQTLDVLERAVRDIDEAAAALGCGEWGGAFETSRMAIGGMSAGGMATLRRLCEPHSFACAAVEGTTGDLRALYLGGDEATDPAEPGSVLRVHRHAPDRVASLDPSQHLEGWRPIPLLVLHSEQDRLIPFAGMAGFVEKLREHYRRRGADPAMIELVSWPETGAPEEHIGFGRFSNDAKNAQAAFLAKHLKV